MLSVCYTSIRSLKGPAGPFYNKEEGRTDMKLTFIGANHEVTGSCHYLEVGKTKVLVDCGME